MNKHSFWTLLWGSVTFCVKNGSCEQFLNRCMENNIPIQNIKNVSFQLTASVPARYYKKLHRLARKSHCTLQCIKKQGICFTAYKLKGRYGLAVGAALFILLPYLFENFIWNIVYYQIPQAQQTQIERILYQNNIFTGKKAAQEDLEIAQQQILLSMPEYAWASLNFVRGKVIVEAGNITNKPPILTKEVCDIVAACDGIITEMEVYEAR
ncbi:MAG: sporulation protein YqfD [Oscillospiraceae bacterium]|nr:sporulation protein YqfD [Oscillospiraceae bacterium]